MNNHMDIKGRFWKKQNKRKNEKGKGKTFPGKRIVCTRI
jgi:hypothetical protein